MKNKQHLIIFASSIFFLPSFFSPQIEAPQALGIKSHISQTNYNSWKQPTPTISGSISYKTLTDNEIKAMYPTSITTPKPSNEQIESWFEIYAERYAVSADTLRKIAWCESHYNPQAVNDIYGGMYQYSSSTWTSTRNAMGENTDPSLRFNAEESIKTSAFKIASGGIGAWPTCSL